MRIIAFSLVLIAGLLCKWEAAVAGTARGAAPTAADRLLLAPDAKVGTETFGELTARWWQWADRMPVAPYLDPDGRLCELEQEGRVWFLAGTNGSFTAKRKCIIPADRHILVPIINMRYSNVPQYGKPLPLPCKVLQGGAAVNNDRLGSAVVLIDGVPVTDVAHYRVRSRGCFPLRADDEESPSTAADGYWLLIKPLPPGIHTLTVGANYAADEDGYGRMVQNFEYVLHVGGRTDAL
ncbi:hypothetical protein [Lysobacter sp. P5_B9]